MFTPSFPYPLVTVGALIIAPDGDTFWVRSHKWKNKYSLPGGKVDLGETLEQAILREIKEETGLTGINPRYALMMECVYSPEFWRRNHFVMHDFIVDLSHQSSKEDVVLNDEAQEYLWLSPEKALELPLVEPGRNLLTWYMKNVGNYKH